MPSLFGMYYDYHTPLPLYRAVLGANQRNQGSPNTPQTASLTSDRYWLSQPRPGTDTTTEVVTVNFKLPLSVSEISWEALRVGCHVEVWYYDRLNNWRQVMDESMVPVMLDLSHSQVASWYKTHFYCYPLVAKKLQFRFTRIYDSTIGNIPFSVGMRNTLIRRNVYTREDGTQGIEPQQDVLGNTFTSYIKDWDAQKAFDDKPYTFWRSMPMPDPEAVCALYLDVRTPSGGAQLMDSLYLDPVYVNQTLNLYYSNDDTVGTMKLSPISAVATTDTNTTWQSGKGRWDSAAGGSPSTYRFPFTWGPLVSQDAWIGIEWAPDFDPSNGPAQNPVLFEVTPPVGVSRSQWWPTIYYDVGAEAVVLELTDGTTTQTYTASLSSSFTRYAPLRIVVGWKYDSDMVIISVKCPDGTELASDISTPSDLPSLLTMDGTISVTNFRGMLTSHIVKLENWTVGKDDYQANPSAYTAPDPVIPTVSGNLPVTTLDNSIYAAAWDVQEHGTGGGHETRYQDKTWTPIWRDYFSQRGRLAFPQQISAKFLKLEFTNLTEESYPIFDSGIKTTYRVFPIAVTQTINQKNRGLLGNILAVGADLLLTGIGAVNWLNPTTVANAYNAIYGRTVQPTQVTAGAAVNTSTLPNTSQLDVAAQTRQEVASPWVYRRSVSNAFSLAGHWLTTLFTPHSQGVPFGVTVPPDTMTQSFTPLVQSSATPATLPTRGQDWWVFPGATLKMPASVMSGLTEITQTRTGCRSSTEYRFRFNTTCIHRYDTKTAIRDAAVAYFAGVREVQPMLTSYITELDPPTFTFSCYDSSQWVQTGIRALDSGPITSSGPQYEIVNPAFDWDLGEWDEVAGDWTWESSTAHDHWYPGAASVVADGTDKILQSSIVWVSPGATIEASVWVEWEGLVATGNSEALQLRAMYYNGDIFVSSESVTVQYANWPASTPVLDGNYWLQIVASEFLENAFIVPNGVDIMRLALVVTADATAGQTWWDTVLIGTQDETEGSVYKNFTTTSDFSKLTCKFSDSGLLRSDSMWARADPLAVNIDFTGLAYYTSTIPDIVPAGMWSDTFAAWTDTTITWGASRALVAINVDPDRIYDGKRVLHFTRAAGAGEAGVKVRQMTNYVSNALFRIGAVFYKPYGNDNQLVLRLRRVSDGVYVYEHTFTPVSGYWYEYVTEFIEIPDSDDQIYTVELALTGDDPDEFYLNDLYTETTSIRYFCRLGGLGSFLHEITPLVYSSFPATVSTTVPVSEFTVEAVILSPRAFLYSCELVPQYLR